MKECTFRPKINDNYAGKHRTINEFVNQQLNFEKRKKDKVE